MSPRIPRSAIFSLAAIVGLIPFASDMYLSSLPTIGIEFSSPVWLNQLTLTGYLFLLGIGQLIAGPFTDAFGRRTPLLIGMSVFVFGSALAALAPSMLALVIARVLQGIGGAIAVVVANSSVRDRTSGQAATRLYAVLLTVMALAPVIAPMVGGFVGAWSGWRAVFWVLTALGVLVLLAVVFFLPESLESEKRTQLALKNTLRGYAYLLTDRRFIVPLAALAAMFMLMFSYIGGASYVYQGDYGMNQAVFGTVFGVTGLALLVGAVLANRLSGTLTNARLGILGVMISVIGTVITCVAATIVAPIGWVVGGLAIALLGLGLCEPAFMGMCMSAVDRGAGQAAAMLGAAQYVFGAIATIVAGSIAASSAVGWTALMLLFALMALLCAVLAGSQGSVSHRNNAEGRD